MHEHISCVSNDMLHTFGSKWLNKNLLIENASKILSDLKNIYGVEMIVDGTPIDSGRDVRILREVSEKSGVKIVASTGLYNYPSMITYGRDETEISEWILEEIKKVVLKRTTFFVTTSLSPHPHPPCGWRRRDHPRRPVHRRLSRVPPRR